MKAAIDTMERHRRTDHVVVGGTKVFEPALNYYRVTRKLDWMLPVEQHPLSNPADFYVVDWPDRVELARAGPLVVLVEEPEWRCAVVEAVRPPAEVVR
ncbi:MAG: hypothetical protein WDO18_18830 [Acidobacteriota bacterium]